MACVDTTLVGKPNKNEITYEKGATEMQEPTS